MSWLNGRPPTLGPSLAALALALSGCGGAGDEAPSNAGPSPAASASTGPAAGTKAEAGATPHGGLAKEVAGDRGLGGQPVEPVRRVDTKDVPAVVKGDIKGGEAAVGGSSEDVLWQAPDPKQVKDEPLTVSVPKGLQRLDPYIPASNPMTKGKVELGRQLYFEPRVSLDGTVSCATCHNPEKGWTDRMRTSVGIDGQVGGRNAPTVLNTVYGRTMFWDGRAPSLEGQAQGPPQNPIEMGKQSYQQIVERLRKISGYREQFQRVFGTDVTLDGMVKAIAAFERSSALSGDSAYDKYVFGDFKALSDSQKRGMVLFGLRLNTDDEFKTDVVLQKAKCSSCHVGFNFTDEKFHNLGIGWDSQQNKFTDIGRFAIDPVGAKDVADTGSFKTPTVRDVTRTAPYMHDGSLKTLEEVVEHYNKGGNPNPSLDDDLKKPLNLTAQEKADLLAFMKALDGEVIKVALPTLPTGPDGKTPNPADALHAPAPKAALGPLFHPTTVSSR